MCACVYYHVCRILLHVCKCVAVSVSMHVCEFVIWPVSYVVEMLVIVIEVKNFKDDFVTKNILFVIFIRLQ